MLSQDILRTIPQFIRVIRRLSTDQLDGAITLQHLRILILVSEGMGQSQMAETLQISLPAISKMVNGLVQRKLILTTPGVDRRCLKLKLTTKGKTTLNAVRREVEKEMTEALKNLSTSQCLELEKGLKVLDKLMIHLKEA